MYYNIRNIKSTVFHAVGYGIFMGAGAAWIHHNGLKGKMILPHIYIKSFK